MRMFIDADACPAPVRELVLRASQRLRVPVVFVSNGNLAVPPSTLASTVRVARGLDVADQHIAAEAVPGDLVVTHDIPLAAVLVKKGVTAIDPRGEAFTPDNVDERLSVRDFMTGLREAGMTTAGPKGYGPADRQRFAATLDRELTRLLRAR
jgi:uncharacterized protein YaiI (UPF0178 family)